MTEDAADESERSGATFVDGAYVLTNDNRVSVCLASKLNEFDPDDAERLADAIREKADEVRGGESA